MDTQTFLRPTGLRESYLRRLGDDLSRGLRYSTVRVRKRHGGSRVVAVPDEELKATLKLLRIRLQRALPYDAPDVVFGYVPGRSIVGNASQHLGQSVVVCVDLVDFFGSITVGQVKAALLRQGLSLDLVELLLPIVVVSGSVPPGFSTSPFISNLVFEETDGLLSAVAATACARYSRYADDLTFSGEHLDDDFLAQVDGVLRQQGWALNPRKTRFMRRGGPQYVTGLYVGDPKRPHIPRRVKKRLRAWFHYIGVYGYSDCECHAELPSVRQLAGWLRHVDQVNPEVVRAITGPVDQRGLQATLDQLLMDAIASPSDEWDALLVQLGLTPER